MPRGESLYHRYPDYRVDLEPNPRRVQVTLRGQIIADSERTLRVVETKHDAVIYFPREDVRMDLLERTDAESFCPFKGEASYWTRLVPQMPSRCIPRGNGLPPAEHLPPAEAQAQP